jgi:hypothetical protein
MLLWWLAALVFRWRFQFSIGALLVLVIAVAMPCSWLAVGIKKAKDQREVVKQLEELRGLVGYDWQGDENGNGIIGARPPGPQWLRWFLLDDFFSEATSIYFYRKPVDDTGMEFLRGLQELQEVNISETRVTDNGLECLIGLTRLQNLWLATTQVTDAGLEKLRGLPQLKALSLDNTKVTDAGLEHLSGLRQLQYLYLNGTNVTDAGVTKLQQALPNCKIEH